MSDDSQLKVDARDGIALFTIDCPAQRNAATPEIMVRLSEAWHEYRARRDWRVAIVTGAGDRAFCAGADLKRSLPLSSGAVEPQTDWEKRLVAERRYPHRVGQTYRLKYSPGHRWFYFPRMRRDEALVFKVYDSETDGRARFTPHTSFDDPGTPPGAPPRQSIEARALAFF